MKTYLQCNAISVKETLSVAQSSVDATNIQNIVGGGGVLRRRRVSASASADSFDTKSSNPYRMTHTSTCNSCNGNPNQTRVSLLQVQSTQERTRLLYQE